MCMQSGSLLRNLFKQEVQFILLGKVIYLGSIFGEKTYVVTTCASVTIPFCTAQALYKRVL